MVKLREYPEEDELVVGTVRQVKGFGAFVSLDEYDNKEGFIHIAEVASGWIKYIRDYIREKQKVVCKVLRVDPSKGHIDLSLKQVNEHQRREKMQEWKNEQKAEKLFELLANTLRKDVDQCYDEFGYKLVETYGTLYDAFEMAVAEPKVFKRKWKASSYWVDKFQKLSAENITLPFVVIGGYLQIHCPLRDGVKHVRQALITAEKSASSRNTEITIRYVGAPRYKIDVKASDYKVAEKELKRACTAAIRYIENYGGKGEFHRE
jgi:translation initiation factor 2 subunit 1